jgi:hypothetical protein
MGFLENLKGVFFASFGIGLGTSQLTMTSATAGLDVDAPVIPRGFGSKVKVITVADSPYTPGDELIILADATGGAIAVNLSALAAVPDRIWQVVKTDTTINAVTITPNGAEKINGTLSSVVISTPQEGFEFQAGTTRWQITASASRVSFLNGSTDTYGDGSLGDVTVAGTTTLAKNSYYSNLVVTGTLNPAGFVVFVLNRISGAGTVQYLGNNAVGATAGAALTAQVLGASAAGGAGSAGGTAGSSGGGQSSSRAAAGTGANAGDGGVGGLSGGGQAGGAKGNATVQIAATGGDADPELYLSGCWGDAFTPAAGGGAGGGGGGATANSTGGGGGGGGGPLLVRARLWDFTGTMSVAGGNGAAAVLGAGTGAGGGAGGGGGWITLVTDDLRVTPTFVVSGGTGGAGVGTGVAGAAGSSGPVNGVGYATTVQRVAA